MGDTKKYKTYPLGNYKIYAFRVTKSGGMQEFIPAAPYVSSELVHFRNRIGEKGIELIFQESIRVNNGDDDSRHHDTAFIDTTVQEKNVTFPTDAKLHKRIVKKVLDIVKKLELPSHQSYTFVLKRIYCDQRFRNHSKNRKKALFNIIRKIIERLCIYNISMKTVF